jgi:hypothetical protein
MVGAEHLKIELGSWARARAVLFRLRAAAIPSSEKIFRILPEIVVHNVVM